MMLKRQDNFYILLISKLLTVELLHSIPATVVIKVLHYHYEYNTKITLALGLLVTVKQDTWSSSGAIW
jgi:hypothetical protein